MRNLMIFVFFSSFACSSGPAVLAVRAESSVDSVARVSLKRVDKDILKFVVFNDSGETLVVDRDAVSIQTPVGERARTPGGARNVYNIPAGTAHDLNVRFDFEGIPAGEKIEVRFEKALRIKGSPVAVAPIIVQRRE